MKKVELVAQAKELNIKGYSRMNKEQLIEAIARAIVQNTEVDIKKVAEPVVETELTEAQQSVMFDLERYANFTVYPQLRTLAPTSGQIRLVKALERNFKVSISLDGVGTREAISNKIHAVYDAIKAGKVQPRPAEEVKELLKHVEPVQQVDKPATQAQINKINQLEKTTGVVNTTVIRNSQVASEVIQKYISLTKANAAKEVAITAIEDKEVKKSFFNMVAVYIKGLFA